MRRLRSSKKRSTPWLHFFATEMATKRAKKLTRAEQAARVLWDGSSLALNASEYAYYAKEPYGNDKRRWLFALVADEVRATFEEGDAALVASWFDRLADGEDPEKVFPGKRGRPQGTSQRKSFEGIPNRAIDYLIAYNSEYQRRMRKKTRLTCKQIDTAIANAFGLTSHTLAKKIWSDHRAEVLRNMDIDHVLARENVSPKTEKN